MIGLGILSVYLAMSKFCKDLCVWAPHKRSAGTFIGPNVSFYSLNCEKGKLIANVDLNKVVDIFDIMIL